MCQQQGRQCYRIRDRHIQYVGHHSLVRSRYREFWRTFVTVRSFQFLEHRWNQLRQSFTADRRDLQNLWKIDRFQRIRQTHVGND